MEKTLIQDLKDSFELNWQDFIQTHYQDELRLSAACRYALEGSGKRARPLLYLLFAESMQPGASRSHLMIPAFALEMLHTYSLVHDDLPTFDDDEVRRGRPTVHIKFDEATALLVGDALLSDAWALLSGELCGEGLDDKELGKRMQMIRVLSTAVGSRGMVLGQMLDFTWMNQQGYRQEDLQNLHQRKTGDLIAAACKLGAIASGTKSEHVALAGQFGCKIGLAFQVIDDLLDEREGTGKSKGKDKEQGKLTFLQTMSYQEAQAFAQQLTHEALEILSRLPGNTESLMAFAHSLLNRKH
ncbi:MAG: polyprenyl synthetase family protein [Oligoflexales bacterium]|nr:polyprenyl synthetase family protein [Oligoflexales bacterium]